MPLRAHTALPADLHYSIYLWALGFHFAGNFSEAEKLPCSLLHLQHRAQCVAHSRHTTITPDGQSFQWKASVEPVWIYRYRCNSETATVWDFLPFIACLVHLSKKLAHPWFLCMILFSLLVCKNSQRMIQSFGYTELCYIKFSLRLGAIGEKFGNLWALYKKELAVRVNQCPHIQQQSIFIVIPFHIL